MTMRSRRLVVPAASALVLLVAISAGPIAASQESDVMATVNLFINALNRNDAKAALSACATQASIIDEFPPHEWEGPNACEDWATAYAAENKKEGITGGAVALGKPWYVNVSGDRAYAVVPATYTYKENGKPAAEHDSIFTVALRRLAAGWRITGWAWSRH
jgi:ketosteroid isomerase-like protein